LEHKAWDIIIVLKPEEVSKRDMERISVKENLPQPIGQTKYFGQVKVVQRKDHLAPRKEDLEVKEGKDDSTKSNRSKSSMARRIIPACRRSLKKLQTRQVNGNNSIYAESEIIDLCGGYLYLLQLAKEHGLFDSDDPFNLFEKETLH
jgi:hypothetical protein